MRIQSITSRFINFEGKRQDRKNVEQLKKNNPYDLNVINQRNISASIENLSKEGGEDNVKFLLDVSRHLKYGTNIDLGKTPNHDWRAELYQAAEKSIEKSPKNVRKKLYAQMDKAKNTQHPLTASEREILDLRESILSKVDRDVLENIKYDNVRNFDRNFDYLISSSEISTAQKLYVMKKLNYLMSPKYKINPQLADKKTQVLAEMVNDMVINTPESKIPNIKSVNQMSVGSCAAISICRKKMAYEDKANYVDIILSELDNKDYMMIYDISKLGSNKKIPVAKPYIDFDYAMKQGFRILDASALNWMNAADATGRANEATQNYVAFDKTFFDTFTDGHIIADIDESLESEQDYYRALLKAKKFIKECKKDKLGMQLDSNKVKNEFDKNINEIQKYSNSLNSILGEIAPASSKENRRQVLSDLRALSVSTSKDISKTDKQDLKNFMYIPNEPEKFKTEKIKNYIVSHLDYVNNDLLDKNADFITDLLANISQATKATQSPVSSKILDAKQLYRAAAAFRTQTQFGLENMYKTCDTMREMGLPDRETMIFNNIDEIIKKLNKDTLNPTVKATLYERFQVNTPEDLIATLEFNRENLQHEMTVTFDELYKSVMLNDRKTTLLKNLKAIKTNIVDDKDKNTLEQMAFNMKMKPDKRQVVKELDKLIDIMENNPSEEDYVYSYNKAGGRNQMLDFKSIMENIGAVLRENSPESKSVISEFNEVNGLPKDAPITETLNKFVEVGEKFNQLSFLTKAFQQALEVKDEDGTILNTVVPKEVIMKKLEQEHKVVPEKDLRALQDKFATITDVSHLPDGTRARMRELPKELTTFSKHEKEILKDISKNINQWYSTTSRDLNEQYKVIKEPLKEQFRQLGVVIGRHWLPNDGHGGLGSYQEVRILESMTDKPYYIEKDGSVAVSKILNSPYSGVSSTSVLSSEYAGHAQYIADIKQVPVKTKDGIETKYAIFHDNTWGAIEHENSWRDENGLLRTDYSQDAGGDGGYITGDNFRNGVFADELINAVGENNVEDKNSKQYKKLLGADGEEYKFNMFSDVIVQGEPDGIRDFASSIKNHAIQDEDRYFKDLKKDVASMTRDELKQKINLINIVPKTAYYNYEKVEKRILGRGKFDKGIDTKAKYDALSNNDEVKLLLETNALFASYPNLPDKKRFYEGKLSTKKISDIKNSIQREARKNFDYSFAKSPDIAKGGRDISTQEIFSLLNSFAKENKLELKQKQIPSMIKSLGEIDKSKFDGSLKNTINLMTNSFKLEMTKQLNGTVSSDKIDEITQKVHDILIKNMYFTEQDMENINFKRDNMPAVEKWIDDTFNPATDKEFAQIYRKLQDMPIDKFKQKYNSTITARALGIKHITGYDLLKKFRANDLDVQDNVFSLLYNIEYYNTYVTSERIPAYDYSKMNRVLAGATYKNKKKSFDETFLSNYYALKSLNIGKSYDRISNDAFRKYNTIPAYVKIETEDSAAIADALINFKLSVEDSVANSTMTKRVLGVISDVRNLQGALDNLDDNAILPEKYWQELGPFAVKFYADFSEDSTVQESVLAAKDIINSTPAKTTVKEYKQLLGVIAGEFFPLENNPDGGSRENNVRIFADNIKSERQYFVTESVDPKYQKNANVLLNKWIRAKVQDSKDADLYFAEFVAFYNKHRITLSPEKLYLEYLMTLAKPTPTNNPYKDFTPEQNEMLKRVKNSYDTEVTSLLYRANLVKLQNLLMNAAKDGNLNKVKRELEHTKVKMMSGDEIDLCSDKGLILMLKSLIEQDDLDTALLFIDQLGLNELAMKTFATGYLSFDGARTIIKRSYNIFDALDKQFGYLNKEAQKLSDIDNDADYKERLIQFRDKVVNYCNHTNFRRTGRIYSLTIDESIKEMEKKPEKSRYALLMANLEMGRAGALDYAQKNVDSLNVALNKFQIVSRLLHSIKLPRNSSYVRYAEEFDNKMSDLSTYISKYSVDFKNVPVSLGDCADMKMLERNEEE